MPEPNYFDIRRFRQDVPEKFLGYPLEWDRDGWISRRLIGQASRILEVGAGDRPFEPELRRRGYAGIVRTMDVDTHVAMDYHSLEEITEPFDAVLMREVVEHIPRPILYEYLERLEKLLLPGGVLIITTPNPWALTWVLADYTHISPWTPADLYGVLRTHGFGSVEIRRIVWPSRWWWIKRAYWAVHSRMYDIDFAGGYIAAAVKSPS